MLLSELFEGSPDIEIRQLSIDSRLPMKDCIFFCLSGIRYDGHDYVEEAIKNGANVIVYEEDIDTSLDAIFIKVSDVADCLNHIASKYYDYPAKKMETYLICGCDGQSSVSYIIYNLLNKRKPCANVGAYGIHYAHHHLYSSVPTLTILDNHKYLNEFYRTGIEAATFESDAQSLSYKKLDGISPDVFVYTSTNEFSGEFTEIGINYYDALVSYLYTLDDDTAIILNRDDASYNELVMAAGENRVTYGTHSGSDYIICDVDLRDDSSSFSLRSGKEVNHFNTSLVGMNNVYNATAALVALTTKGYDITELAEDLKEIKPIDGVMEPLDLGQDYHVYIDCAANVKSIHDVYDFAQSVKKPDARIFALWGINSQDESETLKTIADLSGGFIDHIILTENNTYSGDITNVIKKVYPYFINLKPLVIEDRIIAIESAIELLNKDDILLILGKGNENTITRNLGRESYIGDKKAALMAISKRIEEESI